MSLHDLASPAACATASSSTAPNPLAAAADALLPHASRTLSRLATWQHAPTPDEAPALPPELERELQLRRAAPAAPSAPPPQFAPPLAPHPAGHTARFEAAFAGAAQPPFPFPASPVRHAGLDRFPPAFSAAFHHPSADSDALAAAFASASLVRPAHKPPLPSYPRAPPLTRLAALISAPHMEQARMESRAQQAPAQQAPQQQAPQQQAPQQQAAHQQTQVPRSPSWGEEFTAMDGFPAQHAEVDASALDAEHGAVPRYEGSFDNAYEAAFRDFLSAPTPQVYRFGSATEHPHTRSAADALAEAERLRSSGRLSAAVQAFEEALRRREDDAHEPLAPADRARAWFLLGLSLAETDDDASAILALRQGLDGYDGVMVGERREDHPFLLPSLVALSVSYTNELEQPQAYAHLREWFDVWRARHGSTPSRASGATGGLEDAFSDAGAEGVQKLLREMRDASHVRSEDAGLFVAMGVLHNLNREYSDAANAFRHAVMLQPEDPGLWNKLGATLANGGEGDDALRAYRRAVDINPALIRAWVNVGTAYANRGQFDKAARYYLKSVAMVDEQKASVEASIAKEDRMGHVWGYLRTTLISMNRPELLHLIDDKDLKTLRSHFAF